MRRPTTAPRHRRAALAACAVLLCGGAAATAVAASGPASATVTVTVNGQPVVKTVTIPTPGAFRPPVQADQPAPSSLVQAPPATSSSKVLAVVSTIFQTMTKTAYSHTYTEDTKTGVYRFDCVGSVDYFLARGAPQAWLAMHQATDIPNGYVPNPPTLLKYLQTTTSRHWKVVRDLSRIEPGDVVVMDAITNEDDGTPGHAMIAASAPLLLSNGSYALNVYDSTGTPHGAYDSRRWDPRTTPLSAGAASGAPTSQAGAGTVAAAAAPAARPIGSGLGMGTIQIWTKQQSRLTPKSEQMSWTVGTKPVRTGIIVGRATG